MPSLSDVYIRLALIPGLGPLTVQQLLEGVAKPEDIFRLSMGQLSSIDGIGPARARDICDPRFAEAVAEERALASQHGIRLITRADAEYPKDLNSLRDPPLVLWVRGELKPHDRIALAVVGPRNPSASGHRTTQRFCGKLARMGCCIVSGLARGIDTIAHETTLQAGGRTIAVIGSGFGHIYPQENKKLADDIAANGAVISEFPFNAKPHAGHFPRRNRIVAALSLGTMVIEAGERSGSLITARLAGELGREVLAVPGPIDRPEHIGSNKLIRDGATLITQVDDIISELEPLGTLAAAMDDADIQEPTRAATLNERERQIYNLLSDDIRSIDDIIQRSGLPASAINATMISLGITPSGPQASRWLRTRLLISE